MNRSTTIKKQKYTKPISVRLPEHIAIWLDELSEDSGLDKTQIIRYAIAQLKSEILTANQLRANCHNAGMPLASIQDVSVNAKPTQGNLAAIAKKLEALV